MRPDLLSRHGLTQSFLVFSLDLFTLSHQILTLWSNDLLVMLRHDSVAIVLKFIVTMNSYLLLGIISKLSPIILLL